MKVRATLGLLVVLATVSACRGARLQPAEPRTEEPEGRTVLPAPVASRPGPAARKPAMVVWDESVSPVVDCNPVKTQHTLVVTVLDTCGCPMPGQRVEWILARSRDAVGDIVACDDQYTSNPVAPLSGGNVGPSNAGNKIDNQYAVSVTNFEDETLDAANNYPYIDDAGARMPDFHVKKGQSWITVTSVYEGVTDIIAYVPAIKDGSRHKIFAKKIWADYAVRFPDDAVNLLPDASHTFTVNVRKASDGSGIAGIPVEAQVLDGPAAAFDHPSVVTGPDGNATFTLANTGALGGTNRLHFTAKGHFHDSDCPRSKIVKKTWEHVALECRCATSLPEVNVNDPVEVVYTVTNTGDAPSGDVTMAVTVPPGLQVADGTAFPLNLGNIAPGATAQKQVKFTAVAEGMQTFQTSASSAQGAATSQCACPVNVVRGILSITCVCEPGSSDVGHPYLITGTVKNEGKGLIRNVTITLTWPEGVTPQTQNTATLAELPAGRTDQFEFQGVPTHPGKLVNVITATGDGFSPVTSACELTATQCNLEMVLIAPGKIGYGEPGDFTVKVTNKGDGAATGCVVRVTHGTCLDAGTKDFNLDTIAPGETKSYDWSANGIANAKCTVVAEVTCAGCTQRKEAELKVAGLPAIQCEMSDKDLQKVEKGIFRVGEEFLYVLEVQNDVATQATPPLKVVLTLPPELTFVSATTTRGVAVNGAGQTATTDEFRLDLNEKLLIEYRVRAVSTPAGNLVRAVASIQRASDGTELAREDESTTIQEAAPK